MSHILSKSSMGYRREHQTTFQSVIITFFVGSFYQIQLTLLQLARHLVNIVDLTTKKVVSIDRLFNECRKKVGLQEKKRIPFSNFHGKRSKCLSRIKRNEVRERNASVEQCFRQCQIHTKPFFSHKTISRQNLHRWKCQALRFIFCFDSKCQFCFFFLTNVLKIHNFYSKNVCFFLSFNPFLNHQRYSN